MAGILPQPIDSTRESKGSVDLSRLTRASLTLLVLLTGVIWPELASSQPVIGDPVPDLGDRVEWLVGDPVSEFESGPVYLLDFWATWCPPCYPMIDQLSELQRRYAERGLVVIGIAVGTDVGIPLPKFLEREAPRIAYRIATPLDEEALKAVLVHPSFMDPESFGLPFVMLVDRAGRLAWVDDPFGVSAGRHSELEATVVALLDGTFDLAASIEASRRESERAQAAKELLERAETLRTEERFESATVAMLEAAKKQPKEAADDAVDLFQELVCDGRVGLASSYGRQLLAPLRDRTTDLVRLERTILALSDHGAQSLQLAEDIARHVLALEGDDNPDFLFELAKILAARGSSDAESFRARAVEAATGHGWQEGYIAYISRVDLDSALRQQAAHLGDVCGSDEKGAS